MRVNEAELEVLSSAIVSALLKQGFVQTKVEQKAVVRRIRELLVANVQTEANLEEEAEQLAERHSRQMLGMDRRAVVLGIKQRLAKERGFTL